MADRDGIEFKIGEAFPADSRLARWMTVCLMALNDLLLVNRWLVPKLEDEVESEGYEHLYLARIAGAHLFEISRFLRKSDRFEDINGFIDALDDEAAQDAYRALLVLAENPSKGFAADLKRARNNFAHYAELLDGEAAVGEELRRALAAHAGEGSIGRIRDQTPPITGFRALFADDVAAELTFAGGEKEATARFVSGVSEHIALYLLFSRKVLAAYVQQLPNESWDDWSERRTAPHKAL
jgi:hypothetical protein